MNWADCVHHLSVVLRQHLYGKRAMGAVQCACFPPTSCGMHSSRLAIWGEMGMAGSCEILPCPIQIRCNAPYKYLQFPFQCLQIWDIRCMYEYNWIVWTLTVPLYVRYWWGALEHSANPKSRYVVECGAEATVCERRRVQRVTIYFGVSGSDTALSWSSTSRLPTGHSVSNRYSLHLFWFREPKEVSSLSALSLSLQH